MSPPPSLKAREGGGGPIRTASHTTETSNLHEAGSESNSNGTDRRCASSQVSWISVHEFITPVLKQANGWPMVGTPSWCSLAHDDPRKWCALLDAAQHHALRLELNQEARAEASKVVSGAADWPHIAREIQQLNDFRASRPWAKRVAS